MWAARASSTAHPCPIDRTCQCCSCCNVYEEGLSDWFKGHIARRPQEPGAEDALPSRLTLDGTRAMHVGGAADPDPIFPPAGAYAYLRDVPEAEVHILDTGHFALEEKGAFVRHDVARGGRGR